MWYSYSLSIIFVYIFSCLTWLVTDIVLELLVDWVIFVGLHECDTVQMVHVLLILLSAFFMH